MTVCRRKSFTITIKSFHNYAQAFEEDYAVRSVNNRVLDTVDDIMSSSFLAANFKATYGCYIRVEKMMMKNEDILLYI